MLRLYALCFSLLIAGCNAAVADDSTSLVELSPIRAPDLESYFQAFKKSPYLDSCDVKQMQRRYELVKELTVRRTANQEPPISFGGIAGKTNDSNGAAEFFIRGPSANSTNEPGISSGTLRGWAILFRQYDQIKEHPFDQRWEDLYRKTAELLVDDRNRLVSGLSYLQSSSPFDHETTQGLLEFLDLWMAGRVQSWDQATLDNYSAAFRLRGTFRELWIRCEKMPHPEQDGGDCWLLRNQVKRQLDQKSPKRTSSVRRSHDSLILRLSVGDFDGAQKEVEEIVATYWSQKGHKLRIEWAKPGDNLPSHRLTRIDAGMREFVWDGVIALKPHSYFSVVAHEIGHALGLPDHYDTNWNPQDCLYWDLIHSADLMSSSQFGQVTEELWADLDALYPLPSAAVSTD